MFVSGATAATGASDPPRRDFRRRSVMTTPVGGLGGMGAWVRGLRSATLCARAAPPGFSPGAMGASRPDGLATSVEKIITYMLSQKIKYVLAKTGMVGACPKELLHC